MSGESTDGDGEMLREAVSLLAHDIRVDILLALLDGWAGVHTEPRGYAELMRAVGIEDSGKFNYHLGRLRGVYVEKVEDGYVPTAAATALYRAVLAHRPTERTTRTGTVAGGCPNCGGTVAERYERSFLTVECTECEAWPGVTYSFPVNGLRGRTGGERLEALTTRASHHVGLAQTGQCPFCAGRVEVQFDPEVDWMRNGDVPPVELACDTCSWLVVVGVLTPLQHQPRVAAALTTVGAEPPLDDGFETTVDRDPEGPGRLVVEVQAEDGVTQVAVDDELTVRDVRVRAE
jgi:hypothetical protein